MQIVVNFGTHEATMDGLTFTLVAQGFYQTPIYATFTKGVNQNESITINAINPPNNSGSSVATNIRYTLLNENFMPLMTKVIAVAITSNDEQPIEFGIKQTSASLAVTDEGLQRLEDNNTSGDG